MRWGASTSNILTGLLAGLFLALWPTGGAAQGPPAFVFPTEGLDPRYATVGQPFALLRALRVLVTDAGVNPISGVPVTYEAQVGASGATATLGASSATTISNGYANVAATANTIAGSYTVTATVEGLPPVVFQMVNLPGAGLLTVIDGDNQATGASTAFTTPLRARFADQYNNRIAGYLVTFVGPSSGATAFLSANPVTTDANGEISVTATANSIPGSYALAASALGAVVNFRLTNTAGAPAPTVVAIGPSTGTTAGGTAVTITGTNLTGATAVTIGGTAATSVAVVNSTTITAVTAAGTAGPASVLVTTSGGTNAFNTHYTYVAPLITTQAVPSASLVAGVVTTPVVPVTASGGLALIAFAVSPPLPSGLAFNTTTGEITGTPAAAVPATTYTVTVSDGATPQQISSRTFSLTIGKGIQSISFFSLPPEIANVGDTYSVTANGGASGNPVLLSIDAASTAGACTISGSTVRFTGAGTCIVNANQAGNATYGSALQMQQTISVGKASQTVVFTSILPSPAVSGNTYTVTATGGASSNAVTFSIDGAATTGACTNSGSVVTFGAGGTCIIDANQSGNASYAAATQVQQMTTVLATNQTITFAKDTFNDK